jgi:ribosomal protein S18 acetylase RimI-like enzyme
MAIRVATAADYEAVRTLWETCELTRPWNDAEADFRRANEGGSSVILLLSQHAVLISTVMVGYDGHRGWVYYLAVHPDHRGKGLGRRMMDAAEGWLRERGAPKLQLMVRSENADVIAFYKAIGLETQPVETLGKRLNTKD